MSETKIFDDTSDEYLAEILITNIAMLNAMAISNSKICDVHSLTEIHRFLSKLSEAVSYWLMSKKREDKQIKND